MRTRVMWPDLTVVLIAGVAYGASPYVTLYYLGEAIQKSDAKALEALVNWPAVRQGIKEDICDFVSVDSDPATAGNLPPFGASFMRGIVSSAIDQAVTPQALLAVTSATPVTPPGADQQGPDVRVNWAFFDSPTTFMISLQARGQTDPIKLEMDLRHGKWRVQRVWLPEDLLTNKGTRT